MYQDGSLGTSNSFKVDAAQSKNPIGGISDKRLGLLPVQLQKMATRSTSAPNPERQSVTTEPNFDARIAILVFGFGRMDVAGESSEVAAAH